MANLTAARSTLWILLISFLTTTSSAGATSADMQREWYRCAMQAGNATKWQEIHWLQSMDEAKTLAFSQHKPILVVMHNNVGGDVNSHEC